MINDLYQVTHPRIDDLYQASMKAAYTVEPPARTQYSKFSSSPNNDFSYTFSALRKGLLPIQVKTCWSQGILYRRFHCTYKLFPHFPLPLPPLTSIMVSLKLETECQSLFTTAELAPLSSSREKMFLESRKYCAASRYLCPSRHCHIFSGASAKSFSCEATS